MMKHKRIRWILYCLGILIVIAVVVFIIINGRHYFSRRSIRVTQSMIHSFGVLAPLALVALIFLSTLIPPLPIPVPLVEITAGLMFGFWYGFLLTWFSQVSSSICAFYVSKFFGKHLFGGILNNRFITPYKRFVDKKGPVAIIIIRAMMAAPFNVISYIAGLTQMKTSDFAIATTIGTIPEALLFSFVGTQFKSIHLPLWYLFILLTVLGVIGPIFTFFMLRYLEPKKKLAKK